jgi:hypothetical protein
MEFDMLSISCHSNYMTNIFFWTPKVHYWSGCTFIKNNWMYVFIIKLINFLKSIEHFKIIWFVRKIWNKMSTIKTKKSSQNWTIWILMHSLKKYSIWVQDLATTSYSQPSYQCLDHKYFYHIFVIGCASIYSCVAFYFTHEL